MCQTPSRKRLLVLTISAELTQCFLQGLIESVRAAANGPSTTSTRIETSVAITMYVVVPGANVPVMFWAARHFLHPDRHVFAAKVTVVGALLGAIVGFLVCSRLAMRGAYWWGLLVAAIVWLVVFPKQ